MLLDAGMMPSLAADVATTASAARSDAAEPRAAPEEPCSLAAVATIHCSWQATITCTLRKLEMVSACSGTKEITVGQEERRRFVKKSHVLQIVLFTL